jgi:hypothetical protein
VISDEAAERYRDLIIDTVQTFERKAGELRNSFLADTVEGERRKWAKAGWYEEEARRIRAQVPELFLRPEAEGAPRNPIS